MLIRSQIASWQVMLMHASVGSIATACPGTIHSLSFCRSRFSSPVCNSVNAIQHMRKGLSVLHQVRAAAHRMKENGQRLAADAPACSGQHMKLVLSR